MATKSIKELLETANNAIEILHDERYKLQLLVNRIDNDEYEPSFKDIDLLRRAEQIQALFTFLDAV